MRSDGHPASLPLLPPLEASPTRRPSSTGKYCAWLEKAKSNDGWGKWFSKSNRRFFTIDFDTQLVYYAHSAHSQNLMKPMCFAEIMGAELLPAEAQWASSGVGQWFQLRTRTKTFQLRPLGNEFAVDWVYAFNAARDMAKTISPVGLWPGDSRLGGEAQAQDSPSSTRAPTGQLTCSSRSSSEASMLSVLAAEHAAIPERGRCEFHDCPGCPGYVASCRAEAGNDSACANCGHGAAWHPRGSISARKTTGAATRSLRWRRVLGQQSALPGSSAVATSRERPAPNSMDGKRQPVRRSVTSDSLVSVTSTCSALSQPEQTSCSAARLEECANAAGSSSQLLMAALDSVDELRMFLAEGPEGCKPKLLNAMRRRTMQPGDILCQMPRRPPEARAQNPAAAFGCCLFVVDEGSVDAVPWGVLGQVIQCGAGSVFGDLVAVVSCGRKGHYPDGCTFVARTPGLYWELDWSDFDGAVDCELMLPTNVAEDTCRGRCNRFFDSAVLYLGIIVLALFLPNAARVVARFLTPALAAMWRAAR